MVDQCIQHPAVSLRGRLLTDADTTKGLHHLLTGSVGPIKIVSKRLDLKGPKGPLHDPCNSLAAVPLAVGTLFNLDAKMWLHRASLGV